MSNIVEKTRDYWSNEVKESYFIEMAKGKEVGHKMADLVDEKTDALLTLYHQTKHQHNSQGSQRARSMGDLWLKGENIYHPVNIKTGVVGSEGQPNLVSLRKVLLGILERRIDSYYLLMVKMQIPKDSSSIKPSVIFTDMLDWLDYVTFDAGPGQMMLKANAFFENYDPEKEPHLTISEKVSHLFDLYEDGVRRLNVNRENTLQSIRESVDNFHNQKDWAVTPLTQQELLLR